MERGRTLFSTSIVLQNRDTSHRAFQRRPAAPTPPPVEEREEEEQEITLDEEGEEEDTLSEEIANVLRTSRALLEKFRGPRKKKRAQD